MSEITVSECFDDKGNKGYRMDYINGEWKTTEISKYHYDLFRRSDGEKKYKIFQKLFTSKKQKWS
jgi:hypothetical protein